MTLSLYYAPESPPSLLVLLIAKHLDLELELLKLLPRNKEEITPEFLKANPAHTIPTLVDGDFCLPESRAISIYLLEEYGKDDPLLPKDTKTRALVNHRLFFDLGTIWQRTIEIAKPLKYNEELPTLEKFESLDIALGFLDAFLEGHEWLAGDKITIADYATLISVSFIHTLPDVDVNKHLNVSTWFERAKSSVKGYDDIVSPQVEARREILLQKYNNAKSKESS